MTTGLSLADATLSPLIALVGAHWGKGLRCAMFV